MGGSTGLLVPPNSLKDVGGYESESDAEPERRKSFWTDPRDKEISFKIPSARDFYPERGPDLGNSGDRWNKMEQIAYWILSASPSRIPEEHQGRHKEDWVPGPTAEDRDREEARRARQRSHSATTTQEKERELEEREREIAEREALCEELSKLWRECKKANRLREHSLTREVLRSRSAAKNRKKKRGDDAKQLRDEGKANRDRRRAHKMIIERSPSPRRESSKENPGKKETTVRSRPKRRNSREASMVLRPGRISTFILKPAESIINGRMKKPPINYSLPAREML